MLLFGLERERQFPDTWIQAGRFAGLDKVHLIDTLTIRSSLPRAVDEAIGFVQKHDLHGINVDGARFRVTLRRAPRPGRRHWGTLIPSSASRHGGRKCILSLRVCLEQGLDARQPRQRRCLQSGRRGRKGLFEHGALLLNQDGGQRHGLDEILLGLGRRPGSLSAGIQFMPDHSIGLWQRDRNAMRSDMVS